MMKTSSPLPSEHVTDPGDAGGGTRDSELRLRALADAVPGVLAYVDRDERVVYVSEGSRALHGLAPEQVVGRTLREISSPSAYLLVQPHVRRALSGDTVEYDRSHPKGDGTSREIRARLVPDFAANGEVRGYFGLFTDVTDLIASQRELAGAQSRLLRRQEALSRLVASEANDAGSLAAAMASVTELAAVELGVVRAGLWCIDSGRDAMVCEDMFEVLLRRHTSGTRLTSSDYPRYFAAVETREVIDAADAHADPRTGELSTGYLRPQGMGALLSVPILRRGRIDGVLTCEHAGGPRAWSAEDRLFAVALANHAALVLEGAARRRAEAELLEREETLRASQADLKRIFDALPLAVARWDSEERYLFVNRKFAADRGTTPAAVIGRSIRDVVGDVAYASQALPLARVRDGDTVRYERSIRQPDGTERHFDVIGFPDASGASSERGGYVVALDATEQRVAQQALAASEQSMRALLGNLPGYAYRCANDPDWTLEFASDGVEALTGYRAGEFIDLRSITFAELIHPDDRDRVWKEAQSALAGRELFDLEYRIVTRTGEEKWVWDRAQGVFSPQGELLRIEGLINDISDRKRTEAALVRQTERLRIAQEAAQTIVMDWQVRDDVIEFSDSEQWLRGPLPSRSGKYPLFKDQVHPEDRDRFLDVRRSVLETGQGQPLEFRFVRTDGRVLWILWHQVAIRGADGGVARVIQTLQDVTMRKRAEESLRLSETRFQDFARASGDWFWETDADGRFTAFIDSAAGVPGVAASWHLGKLRTELVESPQELEAEPWKSHLEAVGRREEFRDFRFARRGRGRESWVSVSGVPMFAADGAFLGYRGTGTDVTRQVRLERAARLADERLRSAIELLNEPVVFTDAEERILLANRAFRAEYPATAGEAIGKRYETFLRESIAHGYLPDAIGKEDEWIAERMARRRRGTGSHEQRRKNGAWIRVNDQRLPDGSTITFTLDITASKREAEGLEAQNRELERRVEERTAALAVSEARLRGVIDSVPLPIVCKDRDGKLLLCNTAAAEFAGRGSEDLLGHTVRAEWMDPKVMALLDAADRQVRETGRVQVIPELATWDRAGREIVQAHTRIPFRFSVEHEDAVLGVVQDVTALKAAERELQRLNQELEGRVSARTAELAAANREMEAFSYSISHDLRAPARAMSGFAGILMEDHAAALSDDARKLVGRIASAGVRMGAMIDGLLELARLSRTSVRRQPVDLAELAKETWAEVAANEPHRVVAFTLSGDCACDCDPVLVRNVLQNLLGNAFKYTRRTPVARVEFGAFGEGAERVFYVRDNGAGFDMAYAGKLFGTFQRLHGANEFEGTGVGLSTVQRIVERHGGRIWAEASPDEGASFQFTLGEGAAR